MKSTSVRSLSAALLLAGLFIPSTAGATPIAFGLMTSGDNLAFELSTTDLSLSSYDVVNPFDPADPIFGTSVPIAFQQLLPTPFGPLGGFFKLPELSPTSVFPPPNPGDPAVILYGPGTFSIAIVDATLSLLPWVQGTFTSLGLLLPADLNGVLIGDATVTFSGISFFGSGLTNPGTAAFTLGPELDPTGAPTGNFFMKQGILAAEPAQVPEPASSFLVGAGAIVLLLRRRTSRLRAANRTILS